MTVSDAPTADVYMFAHIFIVKPNGYDALLVKASACRFDACANNKTCYEIVQ
jgi:hypothetical protein